MLICHGLAIFKNVAICKDEGNFPMHDENVRGTLFTLANARLPWPWVCVLAWFTRIKDSWLTAIDHDLRYWISVT